MANFILKGSSKISITASAIGYEDLTLYADSSVANFTLNQGVLELGALDVVAQMQNLEKRQ